MLTRNTPRAVKPALGDDESGVRRHVYEALVQLSTGTLKGVRSLVAAGYASTLVGKAAREVVELQPLALQLLCNCLSDATGLDQALEHGAVSTCITLLRSFDSAVRRDAASTLATLCFAEAAKHAAIDGGAVPILVDLLKDPDQATRTGAAAAVVAVTTTDEGKRAMVPSGDDGLEAVDLLVGLLREGAPALTTNALKCVANVAVHPRARRRMNDSPDCLALLDAAIAGDDALNAKHAEIAKAAVLWEP